MSAVRALPRLPRAVLFDMDGLMLDSEREAQACLSRATVEQQQALTADDLMALVGKDELASRTYLAARLGPDRASALLTRSRALYVEAVARGIPQRPGVLALLRWLAGHGIARAVGTSTQRPLALRKLEIAGLLPYFDTVVTASDVAQAKPAPDIYLLAAARLGMDPADCLVLEDSPIGVRAAFAAGIRVIQVPDLLAPDDALRGLGHRIVASLGEVQQLLEARWAAG